MQHITVLALAATLLTAIPARASDDLDTGTRALIRADAAQYDSFTIAAENGASLSIIGYMQTRYLASFSDGFGDKDVITGFEQPRIRLGVKGKLNDTYRFKLVNDYANGKTTMTTGKVIIKLSDNTRLVAGQFTQPFTREKGVSSSRQLAVERSITHSFFSAGRSQGVMLEVTKGKLRWKGSINDGMKAVNKEFGDPKDADFAFTTRVEYLADGKWKHFKDYQGWRGGKRGLLFGGALHFQSTTDSGTTPAGAPTTLNDIFALTADVSAKFDGYNAMAAVHYMNKETAAGKFTDTGIVLQGGIMTSDHTEVFARWDSIFSDSDRGAMSDDLHAFTAGMNYFFIPESHAAKFTVDVQHVFSDLSSTPVGTNHKRAIQASTDSQTALRAQFVLRF